MCKRKIFDDIWMLQLPNQLNQLSKIVKYLNKFLCLLILTHYNNKYGGRLRFTGRHDLIILNERSLWTINCFVLEVVLLLEIKWEVVNPYPRATKFFFHQDLLFGIIKTLGAPETVIACLKIRFKKPHFSLLLDVIDF